MGSEPSEPGRHARPSAEALRDAKVRVKDELVTSIDGVEGVGLGEGVVRVYVRDESAARQLPAEVDGVALEVVIVGEITAY